MHFIRNSLGKCLFYISKAYIANMLLFVISGVKYDSVQKFNYVIKYYSRNAF